MRIKIDKADKEFSYWIRLRDKKCVRCQSPVRFNDKGYPKSHECSHYHSRGHENTRFDPENCDTLCFACHKLWGGDEREAYTKFKRKQLGEDALQALQVRARTLVKKERYLQHFIWKNKVNELLGLPPYKMREKKVKKSKPKSIKVKKVKTISQLEWAKKCKEARHKEYLKWKSDHKLYLKSKIER